MTATLDHMWHKVRSAGRARAEGKKERRRKKKEGGKRESKKKLAEEKWGSRFPPPACVRPKPPAHPHGPTTSAHARLWRVFDKGAGRPGPY